MSYVGKQGGRYYGTGRGYRNLGFLSISDKTLSINHGWSRTGLHRYFLLFLLNNLDKYPIINNNNLICGGPFRPHFLGRHMMNGKSIILASENCLPNNRLKYIWSLFWDLIWLIPWIFKNSSPKTSTVTEFTEWVLRPTPPDCSKGKLAHASRFFGVIREVLTNNKATDDF